MLNIDRRILTHFDFVTIMLLIPIIFISGWLIYEIHPSLGHKHTIYTLVGAGVFLGVFLLPIRKMFWLIPVLYWIGIGLLIAVELVGDVRLGAKRWIEIPLIHFTLQPSELLKPAFILMMAYLINKNPPPADGYRLKDFLKLSFYILLPFALIAKEPDLGTALVLALVGYGILFIAGVHWKIWTFCIIILGVASPIVYTSLHDYQKQRISDFIGEKPSYQVEQSMIAIGSGGFFGKDKEEATQAQMKFLPIASSDFIYAYVIERFGFLGGLFIIVIYAALIMHLLVISFWSNDYYIKIVAGGVALLFFIYSSVNMAMTIGFAPVVGIPLPMFSYGGSSFVNFIVILAILENLLAYRFRYLYNDTGKKSFL